MWEAQGGCCYLCGKPLKVGPRTHTEHDHSCCPNSRSCRLCRRGLACQPCNHIVGLVQDDMDLLRLIAANFEPVQAAARARIAAADNAASAA